jgi:hypothetical protein
MKPVDAIFNRRLQQRLKFSPSDLLDWRNVDWKSWPKSEFLLECAGCDYQGSVTAFRRNTLVKMRIYSIFSI